MNENERKHAKESDERTFLVGIVCVTLVLVFTVSKFAGCMTASDDRVFELRRLDALSRVCGCDAGAR